MKQRLIISASLDVLTDLKVIERWSLLHEKPIIIQRFIAGQLKIKAELDVFKEIID